MITLSPTLSFFLFIAFITSMQFILMNMFIAFISNAYSEINRRLKAKEEAAVTNDDEQIKAKEHWWYKLEVFFKKCKKYRCKREKKEQLKKGGVIIENVGKALNKQIDQKIIEEKQSEEKEEGLKRVNNIFESEPKENSDDSNDKNPIEVKQIVV